MNEYARAGCKYISFVTYIVFFGFIYLFIAKLMKTDTNRDQVPLGPLLLTWINFNPSMDK